jgi:hypothetical protein
MDEDKLRNQIPVFRFLNRHKWRIILPILFYAGYFYLPFYSVDRPVSVVSHLLVTSTQNSTPENLNQEVTKITEQVQSDESITALINKYGLFSKDRRQGMPANELIDKMRVSMVVGTDVQSPPEGVSVFVLASLPDDGPEKTKVLSDYIISRFESRPDFSVTKIVNPPAPYVSSHVRLSSRILFGLFLVWPALFSSLLLIFIWEIPSLFYSRKTQEMVFDPIRSDWRDERLEAKTHGTIMDGVVVNIRYSFAFIGAMLAKSPIGELFEFVGKVAR